MKVTEKQLKEVIREVVEAELLKETAESSYDVATGIEGALQNYLGGDSATKVLFDLKNDGMLRKGPMRDLERDAGFDVFYIVEQLKEIAQDEDERRKMAAPDFRQALRRITRMFNQGV